MPHLLKGADGHLLKNAAGHLVNRCLSGPRSVWKLLTTGVLDNIYDTGDTTNGIAVDASGNVYVAGNRSGDESVWKLDSSFAKQWAFDTGDNTWDIAVDGSGNVYVVGIRQA